MTRRDHAAAPFHLVLLATLLSAACGGTPAVPGDVIDRETFIATYVDLRRAAIVTTDLRVPAEERDQILARHGVDGEGLMRFADAHGRDLDYMNEVWAEVDTRLQESEPEAESAAEPPR